LKSLELISQILRRVHPTLKRAREDDIPFLDLFARIPYIGSCPFPIQWTFVLDASIFSARSTNRPAFIRLPLHLLALFQTHISVSGPSILFLFTADILFQPVLAASNTQHYKAGHGGSRNNNGRLRTFPSTRADGHPHKALVSLPEGSLSRILGTKFLGIILLR
jgi:hypothetical protein